jgi:hypothetical protein
MIWAKRRFSDAKYAPYLGRLEKLMMAQPTSAQQFIMVSTESGKVGVGDYYVGVPDELAMLAFDGFDRVGEAELPREVDIFHLGDHTSSEFTSRFTIKHRA